MLMQLEPQARVLRDGIVVRRCKIKRINNDVITESELWFELDHSVPLPDDQDCDAYLLAMIMEAMREGRRLQIKGSVSRHLLGNLVEYQAAWRKWKPAIYSCIDITVDEIRDTAEKSPGAICAFSGGVDASFSVWRHSQSKNGYRSQKIKLCSMVHGFDIPLADGVAFENAKQTAAETLIDININLIPIKTNYRLISHANWEDSFTAALVAALSNFKKVAGTCIVGSSEPYDSLVIPWGSSPITDHLLSSGDFTVMHDGACHSRTEKVKAISEWEVGTSNLRVCWQGDLKDRNCGQCEKCLRTKLNFLAVGSRIPTCFPQGNILEDLNRVTLANAAVRAEWRQIYEYAINNNLRAPWINKVKKILNKKSINLVDAVLPEGSSRRKIIKKLTKIIR